MIGIREIREMSTSDLRKKLAELRRQIREHRFGVAVGQERNVSARRNARRTVARILTELTLRERETDKR